MRGETWWCQTVLLLDIQDGGSRGGWAGKGAQRWGARRGVAFGTLTLLLGRRESTRDCWAVVWYILGRPQHLLSPSHRSVARLPDLLWLVLCTHHAVSFPALPGLFPLPKSILFLPVLDPSSLNLPSSSLGFHKEAKKTCLRMWQLFPWLGLFRGSPSLALHGQSIEG